MILVRIPQSFFGQELVSFVAKNKQVGKFFCNFQACIEHYNFQSCTLQNVAGITVLYVMSVVTMLKDFGLTEKKLDQSVCNQQKLA